MQQHRILNDQSDRSRSSREATSPADIPSFVNLHRPTHISFLSFQIRRFHVLGMQYATSQPPHLSFFDTNSSYDWGIWHLGTKYERGMRLTDKQIARERERENATKSGEYDSRLRLLFSFGSARKRMQMLVTREKKQFHVIAESH